jgi:hypothetical protein
VDPITDKYPELTPYQFASNTPIQAIDLDGLEAVPPGIVNNITHPNNSPPDFYRDFSASKFEYTGQWYMAPVTFIDNSFISLWNSSIGTIDAVTKPYESGIEVSSSTINYFLYLGNTSREQKWADTKAVLSDPGFYEDAASLFIPFTPKLKLNIGNPFKKIIGTAQMAMANRIPSRIFNHFSNVQGMSGITGIAEHKLMRLGIGESMTTKKLEFGIGKNPYLGTSEGCNYVTDLGTDISDHKLGRMGVIGDKKNFVVGFDEELAFKQGFKVSPSQPSLYVYTIPAYSKYTSKFTVKRVR